MLSALGAGIVLLFGISRDIGRLEGRIEGLARGYAAERVLDGIEAGRPELVEAALQNARQSGVQLEPTTISDLTTKALNTPTDEAWKAATVLASYRSSLNPPPAQETEPLRGSITTYYSIPRVPGREEERPTVGAYWGQRASETSPILETIGRNMNTGASVTPILLVVRGGVVPLDGMHVRNVIFRDAEIIYHGGPVRLERVRFVNCKFTVDRSRAGELLLTEVAKPGEETSFRLPMA